MHRGQQVSAEALAGEYSALQAEVEQMYAAPLMSLAVDVMAKAYTGQPGPDDEPPWPDPFGQAPTAYEVANWLYLPRNLELDVSQPVGRTLYGLISEALQLLEHASIVRSSLSFGYQGALADAHTRYVLTRYGVAVRDAGAVEHVLKPFVPSTS